MRLELTSSNFGARVNRALCGVTLGLVASTAHADVLKTTDGREIEGQVTETSVVGIKSFKIETPYGDFTLPADQVASWEEKPTASEEYVQRLVSAESAGDGAAGAQAMVQLARWCESKGLAREAQSNFQRALELEPGREDARLALGWRKFEDKWVSPDRVLEAAGFVRFEGQWILPGEKELLEADGVPELDELTARHVQALVSIDAEARKLAEAALSGADQKRVIPQLLLALRSQRWDMRAGAARMLGKLGGKEVLNALLTRVLVDRVEDVRMAAVDGLREGQHADAYAPLVKSLAAEELSIRANAIAALGELDDERAVSYLVKHIFTTGSGPRSHIYIGKQIAYVRDYDVEVAQRAAIADPIIGTIQDGLVLDVRVNSVQGHKIVLERRMTSGALSNLTGAEPPGIADDPARAWALWWRENRHEYEPGGSRYRAP